MRLTAELIGSSLSYLNPLKERELDLRGHKIPAIENLGVAKDQDAIDFTDNDIQTLGNLPFSPRLKTLLLARNRVQQIQSTIAESAPNLENLVLNSNMMKELADLEPLSKCRRLNNLVLMDNPVTRKEHYRHFVIWKIPSVRFLDYQHVKLAEREKAEELFGTPDEPSPLAAKIMGIKTNTFEIDDPSSSSTNDKPYQTKLTEAEKKVLKDKIRNAKSLDEITRLEKELRDGSIVHSLGADAMEE
ncbi:L domain-like protein [Ascobolus immersus RN42]|uniref:U2 small nuclear ribonucleoprotein A' n=1 Tax=Ascobolus immersus RN42 TaxID=1160509 RepID=A0A3N4IQH9_ASCIM|nr:L domain-like protein [Ascobolus immersus RN42]